MGRDDGAARQPLMNSSRLEFLHEHRAPPQIGKAILPFVAGGASGPPLPRWQEGDAELAREDGRHLGLETLVLLTFLGGSSSGVGS